MLADIIVVAIVGVLFVLCIRKQVMDYKKGIPSCGLNCSGCSGCGGSGSCQSMKTSKQLKAKACSHKEKS